MWARLRESVNTAVSKPRSGGSSAQHSVASDPRTSARMRFRPATRPVVLCHSGSTNTALALRHGHPIHGSPRTCDTDPGPVWQQAGSWTRAGKGAWSCSPLDSCCRDPVFREGPIVTHWALGLGFDLLGGARFNSSHPESRFLVRGGTAWLAELPSWTWGRAVPSRTGRVERSRDITAGGFRYGK